MIIQLEIMSIFSFYHWMADNYETFNIGTTFIRLKTTLTSGQVLGLMH